MLWLFETWVLGTFYKSTIALPTLAELLNNLFMSMDMPMSSGANSKG